MVDKPQLHVTHLNMMARCGVQWQRRYGARFGVWDREEKIPPGIAAVVGTATHAAVEANLRNKIKHGELLPVDAVRAVARDKFHELWGAGLLLSEDEAADQTKTMGAGVDQSVALANLHHVKLAPFLEPTAIEERFVIVCDGYPVDLSGTIDVVEAFSDKPLTEYVRDTKTIARVPQDASARTLQMTMSAQARKGATGRLPGRTYNDNLVKTKTPKYVRAMSIPQESWWPPLWARIVRAVAIIEAVREGKQAFSPAQPEDWVCRAAFCGYARTCPYWSGRE